MAGLDVRRVTLYPLTFVEDGHEVVVGRPDTESYAVLAPDGAAVLRLLGEGTAPTEVAAWYARVYGEELDIAGFLAQVSELGFVRDGSDESDGSDEPEKRAAAKALRFQRTATVIFSRTGALVAAVLAAGATWSLVTRPETRPTPTHVFFTGYLVLIPLVMLAIELPLMCLHEWFHVLAGRRLGINSRVGIGRRLYFIVFQTTLTGVYSLPRNKRYLIFVAGMIADAMVLCSLVLVGAATLDGPARLVGRIAVAAAYFTAIRFVWQFLFFIETDMHHVLSTFLRVTDLRGLTSRALRSKLRREPLDPSVTPHERAILRWFVPVTLVGAVGTLGGGLATVIPLAVGYVRRVAEGVGTGTTGTQYWDAVVSLAMILGQATVIAVLFARRRPTPRAAASSPR
jgi:hypothetical protein